MTDPPGPSPAPDEGAWAALGIEGEYMQLLQAEGVTPVEASIWITTGVDILEWRGSEFTVGEAGAWCEIGVYFPADAVQWLELGLPRSDVALLAEAGLEPEEWPLWAAGTPPEVWRHRL